MNSWKNPCVIATAKRATQTAFPYAIQNRYYVDFRVIATDAAGYIIQSTH